MATLGSSARGETPQLRVLLWHLFGTGDSASQITLSRGAGDVKRAGFGLARCHGTVNSEKTVVLTDFKWFGEWRAMGIERYTSAGVRSCLLSHVGIAFAVQVGLAVSRLGSVVQATSTVVSRDGAAVVQTSPIPGFLRGGAQPCLQMGGPRAQVFSCTSPARTEPGGPGVPCLFPVVGNAAGLREGRRNTRSYGVLHCPSPSGLHLPFRLDEFSSLVSQRSVAVAGVTHCL